MSHSAREDLISVPDELIPEEMTAQVPMEAVAEEIDESLSYQPKKRRRRESSPDPVLAGQNRRLNSELDSLRRELNEAKEQNSVWSNLAKEYQSDLDTQKSTTLVGQLLDAKQSGDTNREVLTNLELMEVMARKAARQSEGAQSFAVEDEEWIAEPKRTIDNFSPPPALLEALEDFNGSDEYSNDDVERAQIAAALEQKLANQLGIHPSQINPVQFLNAVNYEQNVRRGIAAPSYANGDYANGYFDSPYATVNASAQRVDPNLIKIAESLPGNVGGDTLEQKYQSLLQGRHKNAQYKITNGG